MNTISTCDPMTYLVRAIMRRGSSPLVGVSVVDRIDGAKDIRIAYPAAVHTVDGPVDAGLGRQVYFGANSIVLHIPGDDDPETGYSEEWRLLSV